MRPAVPRWPLSPSQPRFTLRERTRYHFDNLLGRGAGGMVLLLGVTALAVILIAGLIIVLLGIRDNDDEQMSYPEAFWQSLMRTMDPGAMGGDVNWPLRIASLLITIAGIFIVSSLIGILIAGLDARLSLLQRGRGRIAVAGHTLILGWSPKALTILTELAIANEGVKGAHAVVLADRDKQELDELIASRLGPDKLGDLKVVTRRGLPYESSDLAIVNPGLAKSIIVLGDESTTGDAGVIKTTLALLNEVQLDPGIALVVEIASPARAKALRAVTGRRAAIVEPGDVIARTAAQGSRETGLNLVLQELFDFDGDEIYFQETPQAVGQQFGSILNCFAASTVIGVRTADGEVHVHPPAEMVIKAGDQLIVIAADDSAITWTGPMPATAPVPAIAPGQDPPRRPDRMVMFGWNDYGRAVIEELDSYVAPGSTLCLAVDPGIVPEEAIDLPSGLANLDLTLRLVPDAADPVGTVLREVECDHVVILCYRADTITAEEAESRSLMTFLEARAVLADLGRDTNVTAELIDERDVTLIPAASAAEFMVSERLASLMMSQLSENVELEAVFADLLDSDGSELYCKPAERYATPGTEVTFADLVVAALARGELAIGWQQRTLRGDPASGFGVRVNPPKQATITFAPGDQLVVLAADDA